MFESEQVQGQLDYETLMAFGILHCGGPLSDKVRVLWRMIQNEDAEFVAAMDKDFEPFFRQLYRLCSYDILSYAIHQAGLKPDDESIQAAVDKMVDAFEDMH